MSLKNVNSECPGIKCQECSSWGECNVTIPEQGEEFCLSSFATNLSIDALKNYASALKKKEYTKPTLHRDESLTDITF